MNTYAVGFLLLK